MLVSTPTRPLAASATCCAWSGILTGGLRLLIDFCGLGIHSLDAGLSPRVDVFNVLRVLRREIVEFVGLVDERGGLLL